MVNKNPAMNASVVQFEGYPLQGVRVLEPDSTACAHREDALLVYDSTPFLLSFISPL